VKSIVAAGAIVSLVALTLALALALAPLLALPLVIFAVSATSLLFPVARIFTTGPSFTSSPTPSSSLSLSVSSLSSSSFSDSNEVVLLPITVVD
jgi:hypothetical protein